MSSINKCRVCLENVRNFKEFSETLVQDADYLDEPKKEETIQEVFESMTKLNISDKAPMFLCISCTKHLRFAYDFIRRAIKADLSFRKYNSGEEQEVESVKLEEFEGKSVKPQIEEEEPSPESPESNVEDFVDEEEYIIENEEAVEEEEYLLELNDDQLVDVEVSVEDTNQDKRLTKNKKYVSRKDIPAKFSCSQCSKMFVHKFLLKAHLKDHDPTPKERSWQCTKCDKSFFRKEILSRHLHTVHREGRDYKCNICGKEFQYKERLTRHLRIHIDRRFQCSICDKRYVQNADLNVHMRTHTLEKPYSCDQCDEAFANKSRLTVHVNRKHLDLVYKCKYCALYECKSYGSMRRHEIEHLKCPFQCPSCDKGFSRKKRFQEHLKQAHECEMTEEDMNNMYIRNMNEAKRMELELKNIDVGESEATHLQEDYQLIGVEDQCD